MLFGAFLMKNIFIIFPTHILNYIFCSISAKISCFFKQSWQLCTTTSDKTYEKYWIFWWNYAKNIVQNMSWKNDENIFHQKCTKQHCLVTESVSILWLWRDHIDPCEKKSSFFMFVDYYTDYNSKCMHHIIALQKHISFVRARIRK